MVILRDEVKLLLAKSEEKLQAAEEELKTLGQSLELAQRALSRREISSNTMISSAVPMLQRFSRTTCLILTWRFFTRTSLLMK
jgi:hypothetical protein